jgi:hypothetical protein
VGHLWASRSPHLVVLGESRKGGKYEMDVAENGNGRWTRWKVLWSMANTQKAVERVCGEHGDEGVIQRVHVDCVCPFDLG